MSEEQSKREEQFLKFQEAVVDIKNSERANAANELLAKMGLEMSRKNVHSKDMKNEVDQEHERE